MSLLMSCKILGAEPDYSAGNTSPCVTCLQGLVVTTFAKVVTSQSRIGGGPHSSRLKKCTRESAEALPSTLFSSKNTPGVRL